MATVCRPVSEIVGSRIARELADPIEAVIRKHYCDSKGACSFFPGGTTFYDSREGVTSATRFIAFVADFNPNVDVELLASQFRMRLPGIPRSERSSRIPDLMTHEPPIRVEFYEIKPNSESGRRDGRNKLLALEAFLELNGLDYDPGHLFRPDKTVRLTRNSAGLFEVEVALHFFAPRDGLILYEVCTDVRQKHPSIRVDPKVIEALMRAVVVLVIGLLILATLPVLVLA